MPAVSALKLLELADQDLMDCVSQKSVTLAMQTRHSLGSDSASLLDSLRGATTQQAKDKEQLIA